MIEHSVNACINTHFVDTPSPKSFSLSLSLSLSIYIYMYTHTHTYTDTYIQTIWTKKEYTVVWILWLAHGQREMSENQVWKNANLIWVKTLNHRYCSPKVWWHSHQRVQRIPDWIHPTYVHTPNTVSHTFLCTSTKLLILSTNALKFSYICFVYRITTWYHT